MLRFVPAIKIVVAGCVLLGATLYLLLGYYAYLVISHSVLSGAHYTVGNYVRFVIAGLLALLSIAYIVITIRAPKD